MRRIIVGLGLALVLAAVDSGARRGQGQLRHRLEGRGRAWRLLPGDRRRHLQEARPRRDPAPGRAAGEPRAAAGRRPRSISTRRPIPSSRSISSPRTSRWSRSRRCSRRIPSVLIAHPGVGNDSLAALKGKPIMIGADTRVGWWLFLKSKFGYTDDQIRPYNFNIAPFLADPNAVQQGYLTSEPFTIEQQGVKPVVMLIADAGYSSYGSIIADLAQADRGEARSGAALRRCQHRGLVRAISTAIRRPANALIKKDNPEMTDALLAYAIAKMKEYGIVDSGDATKDGIGAMSDARWQDFFKTMADAGALSRGHGLPQGLHAAIRQQARRHAVLRSSDRPATMQLNIAKRRRSVTLDGRRQDTSATAPKRCRASISPSRRGAFVSLLGPSGCGKSTLLRIIAGPRRRRARGPRRRWSGDGAAGTIGFVFQEPTLMPWATVWDNVYLPLRLAGRVARATRRRRSRRRSRAVGLAGFEQRLSARALGRHAHARLDRPRARHRAAAAAARRAVRRARRDHALQAQRRSAAALAARSGWTVVFVTHSVFESVFLSNRIVVMTPRPGPHRRRSADRSALSARARACAPRPITPRCCRAVSRALAAGDARARMNASAVAQIVAPLAVGVVFLAAWEAVVRWSRTSRPTSCRARCVDRRDAVDRRAEPARLAAGHLAHHRWRRSPRRSCSAARIAILFAQSRLLEISLFPYAVILQVTPIVAIAPLIIIWVNDTVPRAAGLRLDRRVLPDRRQHHARAQQRRPQPGRRCSGSTAPRAGRRLRYLRLPTALPYFLAGVRISGGLALIGAVVAEFVAGTGGTETGLASRILEAGYRLQIPRLFAALLLLSLTGIVIFAALSWLTPPPARPLARKRPAA